MKLSRSYIITPYMVLSISLFHLSLYIPIRPIGMGALWAESFRLGEAVRFQLVLAFGFRVVQAEHDKASCKSLLMVSREKRNATLYIILLELKNPVLPMNLQRCETY